VRDVKIQGLRIENFMGHPSLMITADGQDLYFSSRNGCGKTTAASAIVWLFSGYGWDQGKFTTLETKVRPADPVTMLPIPGLITVVEMAVTIDGKARALKKQYRTIESPVAGTANTKTTNETKAWIDGYEKKVGEFESWIDENICPRRNLLLASVAGLFNSWLSEKDKREILLSISGDVSPEDVAASTAEFDLSPLLPELAEHKIEEVRANHLGSVAKDKAEHKEMGTRIDEASKSLKVIPAGNWAESATLREHRLNDHLKRKADAQAGGGLAELRVKVAELGADLIKRKNELSSGGNPAREAALKRKRELESQIADLGMQSRSATTKIAALEQQAKDAWAAYLCERDAWTEAKADLDDLNSRQFTGSTLCGSCGQELPEDKVEALREKFNLRLADEKDKAAKFKARMHEDASKWKGQTYALKGFPGDEERGLPAIVGEIPTLEATVKKLAADGEALQAELRALVIPSDTVIDFEADEAYAKIAEEQRHCQALIVRTEGNSAVAIAAIDQDIETAQDALNEAREWVAAIKSNADTQKRVAEYTARQKALKDQIEEHERLVWLCDRYQEAWVAILDAKVSAPFEFCRWKMLHYQVNDGVKQVCVLTWRGTGAAPSAGQSLLCGVDICQVLQRSWGVNVPVLLDGAESLTEPFDCGSQLFRFVAEPGIDTLRIETTTENETRHHAKVITYPREGLEFRPSKAGLARLAEMQAADESDEFADDEAIIVPDPVTAAVASAMNAFAPVENPKPVEKVQPKAKAKPEPKPDLFESDDAP
jgi:hypothetical protein